ncbi:hypothetical protein A2Z67_00950 [Candidatus Woesebacteria bacterium RBG_13_36_22]|uniref:Uncharacterized protein n=1 Tax=Candidatus Woesebacteria bacterium RBG_13_36_22 TaxID=1802478 RepID=A0A1F7X030_9BACT|nr:MAG: hypothetical protein A2Z67_00950 [Candidatus Woesebacteria bacterium RBG_13_36_22]
MKDKVGKIGIINFRFTSMEENIHRELGIMVTSFGRVGAGWGEHKKNLSIRIGFWKYLLFIWRQRNVKVKDEKKKLEKGRRTKS